MVTADDTLLVGISGYANVGKDAAAAALLRSGWLLGKFSQPMKDAAYAADPEIVQNGITYSYAKLMDAYGIEAAKDKFPGTRAFMQRLGKAMRDHVGEDVWINAALAKVPAGAAAVFVDCRYRNEADAIRARRGMVLRINRPGVEPAVGPDGTVHVSEIDLDDYPFDAVIDNDGSIADLHYEVETTYRYWREDRERTGRRKHLP